MRFAVFLFLFLLAPLSLAGADEHDQGDRICVISVPTTVLDLPKLALDKAKLSLDQAKDTALGAVKSLPEKIDELALSLADKLESSKTPQVSVEEPDPANPQVLGATSTDFGQSLTASAYNAGADVLSFLLRHWLWTISGLGVLALFWSFRL